MRIDVILFKKKIDAFYKKLKSINEKKASIRISEDKWTIKEMIAHLIDSACNNHQRFVRLQSTALLEFPKYDPEAWVKMQNPDSYDWKKLVELWKNYNDYIINIISNIKEENLNNSWNYEGTKKTLEFLINDYYNHINWHEDFLEQRLKEIK